MFTRLKILGLFYISLFLILILRLFFWQISKGRELSAEARSQHQSSLKTTAYRGSILAADRSWLVSSGEAWLLYASLREIDEPKEEIASRIAKILVGESKDPSWVKLEKERIFSLLNKRDVSWVALKQKLTPEMKEKIESLKIRGLGFEPQQRRIYPEASSAAHLLGFVGKDKEGNDTGYFGLEGYYDLALAGKSGYVRREEDAQGIPIPFGLSKKIEAVDGVDLITFIDKTVQNVLDKKLLEGIEKYGAKGGTAIVMDPKSGAILAMSSFPNYDPENYWEYGDKFFSNPAISSSFEPGSIFKVIVMASALDAGVVDPDTICDICNGPVRVGKYVIETWNKVYHPNSNMTDIIVNSDNVGMVFVGRRLGETLLYNYLRAFGFGEKTGIDLQGEESPPLRDKSEWKETELATVSFGQGIAVTPIQMISAVSVIANDGILVRPRVVFRLESKGWGEDLEVAKPARIISSKAANEVTSMMVEAAKRGESKWTHLKGFKVAGKTGTAQIPIEGYYDPEKTIASFIGFAPYDDPKFVMLVTLNEPKSSPWASETAAPLWYSIAKELFFYFGILPEN